MNKKTRTHGPVPHLKCSPRHLLNCSTILPTPTPPPPPAPPPSSKACLVNFSIMIRILVCERLVCACVGPGHRASCTQMETHCEGKMTVNTFRARGQFCGTWRGTAKHSHGCGLHSGAMDSVSFSYLLFVFNGAAWRMLMLTFQPSNIEQCYTADCVLLNIDHTVRRYRSNVCVVPNY